MLFLYRNLSIIAQKNNHPKNEFRAVYIATVVNIDWSKQATDSIQKQQSDFIEILDTYKKLNYNAVIVQIRSVGDAFYLILSQNQIKKIHQKLLINILSNINGYA